MRWVPGQALITKLIRAIIPLSQIEVFLSYNFFYSKLYIVVSTFLYITIYGTI
jgi:hypothetical protein